jgi:hypothetical protein
MLSRRRLRIRRLAEVSRRTRPARHTAGQADASARIASSSGRRSDVWNRAAERHGTKIVAALSALPDALPELAEQARSAPGDRTGWDWAGPWDGYCLDWSDLLKSVPSRPPAA